METTTIQCPNCREKITITLFVRPNAPQSRRSRKCSNCGEKVSYGVSVGANHVPLASESGTRDDDSLEKEAIQLERDPTAG